MTVQGTATDGLPGLVGGVEVSVDGGLTWHPAVGRSAWSYAWTPVSNGAYTLLSRAVDDSGNLETPGAGITVTVGNPPPPSGPVSIWAGGGGPTATNLNDGQPIEVGVKFRSSLAGWITHLRFYKGTLDNGTHVGHLWSSLGVLLATRDVHRRDGVRLAGGGASLAGRHHREHHVRRVLPFVGGRTT